MDKTDKLRLFYAFLIVASLVAIGAIIATRSLADAPTVTMPYSLNEPLQKFTLDKELREISGLSYLGGQRVLAVQDENGFIYELNLRNGEITGKYEFHKDGDYEGIAHHADTAWIVRSDGHIYEIIDFRSSSPQRNKYETFLDGNNNIEGLCYVPHRQALWLACKNDAGTNNQWEGKRAVYEFNLLTKTLQPQPIFLLNENAISDFLTQKYGSALDYTFKPSGIEVHPLTQEVYIIASAGKLLVSLFPDGRLKDVEKLSSLVFKQPEGITFDEAGNLIVSNEAKKGKANLLIFNYLSE